MRTRWTKYLKKIVNELTGFECQRSKDYDHIIETLHLQHIIKK